MDNLMVLEVNPEQLVRNIEFPLFKSPNCVSVGTSIALKAIADAYGVAEAATAVDLCAELLASTRELARAHSRPPARALRLS